MHSGAPSTPTTLPALTETAEAQSPASSALQEIAWLKQQGFLSEEEAERKQQQILSATTTTANMAGDKSKASFRQRIFGGNRGGAQEGK